jgi:hypothetical protein
MWDARTITRAGANRGRAGRRKTDPARSLRLESLEERALLSVEPITLTDSSYWGTTAHGPSTMPYGDGGPVRQRMVTSDGQRIVFQSDAANLVPNDNNGRTDVFLYDRGTGLVRQCRQHGRNRWSQRGDHA